MRTPISRVGFAAEGSSQIGRRGNVRSSWHGVEGDGSHARHCPWVRMAKNPLDGEGWFRIAVGVVAVVAVGAALWSKSQTG
jgi:hypothetical protein